MTRALATDPFRLAPPAAPPAGFALPAAFWSRFHEAHWEQRGAVLQQPFAAPLAGPDETFRCLVAAGDRVRAGDRGVPLEFCIEHAQLLADVGRYLPEQGDGSAEGYAERVTRLLGGRKFGLVVEGVQAYDATLWLRLRDFLRGLFEHTGLPGDSAKATVFLGNYDSTPFGLHRGSSGNFMFVVEGRKRMRTWPDAFFRGKEDLTNRLDYHHYDADSIVLDADPGDVIYWPSDYWHIGESVDGKLSSAVSVALFMAPRETDEVLGRARRYVQQRVARGGDAVAALREAADDPRLARDLSIARLNHASALGFTSPPAPLPTRPLADDAVVRALPEYPVLWTRAEDDELVCSANGHAFGITASPRVLALLERLNAGAPHRVGDLVRDHAGTAAAGGVEFETSPESVRALLEKLTSLRALVATSLPR